MTAHQRNLSSSSTSPIVNNVHLPDPDWTRTNTLALTSMPALFFNPIILDALRSHFEGFGEIHTWAPLKAFSRVLVVYYDEEAAELAKESCDSLFVDATDFSPSALLRVYRADPTPLDQLDGNNLLRPPQLEKNFLISPPGSPPVGWEPIREDPPNHAPLADDLMVALRRLQIEQSTGGVEVLIHPDAEEGPGIGVYVEDCDGPSEPPQEEPEPSQADWIYGQSRPQRIPTSRPPMRPQPASMPPLRVGA